VSAASARRFALAIGWLCLYLCLGCPGARAEPASEKVTRAKAHFEAGRALYTLGRYEEAEREFTSGYLLVPKAQFLINLGQVYRRLGRLDKACEMFRRFHAEAPPDDPQRATVDSLLKEVEQTLAEHPPAPPPKPPPPAAPAPSAQSQLAAPTVAASTAPPTVRHRRKWWIIPVVGGLARRGGGDLFPGHRADPSIGRLWSGGVRLHRPAKGAVTRFGRYQLLEEIGRGGMATLFRARLAAHGHAVAILAALLVDVAGCNTAPTSVLLQIDTAPGVAVSALSTEISIAGVDGGVSRSLPDGGSVPQLPNSLIVLVPDTAADVTITLDARDAAGLPLSASTVVRSRPHQQVTANLRLGGAAGGGPAGPLAFSLTAAEYPFDVSPSSVVVADFDGDHVLDIAVCGVHSKTVALARGVGGGALAAPMEFTFPSNDLASITAGDFNGDGHLDLVLPYRALLEWVDDPRLFRVLMPWSAQPDASRALVADLNSDGKLDLAIAVATGLDVILGNGDGTFAPAHNYPLPGVNIGVSVYGADLNRDGRLDLVVGSSQTDDTQIAVLLGGADGAFSPPNIFPVGLRPHSLAIFDVNRDGKLDLVVSTLNGVLVLTGMGDGTFIPAATAIAQAWGDIVAADLDQDGQADVAVASQQGAEIDVLLRYPNGDFRPPMAFPVGKSPTAIVARDLDGDGRVDLITANTNDNGGSLSPGSVTVLLNTSM
jgi:hypothetical protein